MTYSMRGNYTCDLISPEIVNPAKHYNVLPETLEEEEEVTKE